MKIFLTWFLIGVAIVLGIVLAGQAASQSEQAECVKWAAQAKEYQMWWSTKWQIEQCKAYGIELKK